jgi:hypothetical protein
MLKIKNKKETETELAHIDVFVNDTFLGYIIKNNSKYARIGENWNFVSKSNLPNFFGKTKNEMLKNIENSLVIKN